MKKILFLALHLGYGGAEKAISAEANLLSERYDVEIVSVYRLYEEPAFQLSEKVKVKYLLGDLKPNKEELKTAIKQKKIVAIIREGWKSIKVLYCRRSVIREVVRTSDADIIISTRYLFHKILRRNKKPGVITIAQEHNHHNGDENYIKRMVRAVRGIDYFMPVSRELTDFYQMRCKKTNCVYIPHSLDFLPQQISSLSEPNLIAVGRFSQEKGFEELIRIFARIVENKPEWKLHLVGDGEERVNIEKRIVDEGVSEHVVLHGYQGKDYISELLTKSSIYLMTSYTESFGIVLIEAQSFGIPCIAFDSARGALEIIEDGKSGYLISDRDEKMMQEKTIELIENLDLRKKMGSNGRKNALQYDVKNVKKQWFTFIDEL